MKGNRRRTSQRSLLRKRSLATRFDQRLRYFSRALAGEAFEHDEQVAADDRDGAQRHLAESANSPRPSSASTAMAAGSKPTWSWPLVRSLTTSTGDLAAAGTAFVSGQRALMAEATALATSSAPGRISSVTTTRCAARYPSHRTSAEWQR